MLVECVNGGGNCGKNEKDEKSTIVVYNFIRAPKNYMRLGEQHFVASNFGGRCEFFQQLISKVQ